MREISNLSCLFSSDTAGICDGGMKLPCDSGAASAAERPKSADCSLSFSFLRPPRKLYLYEVVIPSRPSTKKVECIIDSKFS